MNETNRKSQIYAIDFDGTIAETKWPDIIGPNKQVVDFIRRLHNRGDQWILWTNRDGENLDRALDWCRTQGIVPDAVNDNLPQLKEFFGNNPRKIFANFYIDDHNAGGVFLPDDDDVAPGAGQEEKDCNESKPKFTSDKETLLRLAQDMYAALQALVDSIDYVQKLGRECNLSPSTLDKYTAATEMCRKVLKKVKRKKKEQGKEKKDQ